MGPHIEPPEGLKSLLNQLNTGFSVSSRDLPIQRLYTTTVVTDFRGCGSHEDFYRDCVERVKPAITYSWKKISKESGNMLPPYIKLNYSVGRLPSEPHKYNPAWITPVSRFEYNIIFNENNEEMLKPYAKEKCTSVMSHETGVHAFDYSLGMGLSERETEEMNLEALHAAGLHREAYLTKRGSNYVREYHQKRA